MFLNWKLLFQLLGKFKTAQSFGNNRAISITSFLNSTLIKIFCHLRYENLSTVYSFQATLSNHLKYQNPEVFRWCGEGRSAWNELIWSFVSGKAQTMRFFLAVNFFHFFWTCCWAKEMIYLNKRSSTPAQKIGLENSLQQTFATISKLLIFRHICATSFRRKRSIK